MTFFQPTLERVGDLVVHATLGKRKGENRDERTVDSGSVRLTPKASHLRDQEASMAVVAAAGEEAGTIRLCPVIQE
jgi:hypothetical protein